MRNFFITKDEEGKISEITERLAYYLNQLHFKHGKLNKGSLNCFYKIGVLGNQPHLFAQYVGNKLIEMIEREDKVAVNFYIYENGDASEIHVQYYPVSQYKWDDLYHDCKKMNGKGVCFSFIFNGDIVHSPHWFCPENANKH